MTLLYYAQKNLTTQGFTCTEVGFERIAPWLRLNPAICLTVAIVAFITGSAPLFFVMAGLGALGALFKNSPGDVLYNTVIRHMLGTPKIPPAPAPRRFACFVGMVWALAIDFLLLNGYLIAAYTLALVLILVIIPMVAVHFCIASVIYQALRSPLLKD